MTRLPPGVRCRGSDSHQTNQPQTLADGFQNRLFPTWSWHLNWQTYQVLYWHLMAWLNMKRSGQFTSPLYQIYSILMDKMTNPLSVDWYALNNANLWFTYNVIQDFDKYSTIVIQSSFLNFHFQYDNLILSRWQFNTSLIQYGSVTLGNQRSNYVICEISQKYCYLWVEL